MKEKINSTSRNLIKRLIVFSGVILVLLMILIYAFTKSIFYSIIFCLGAIISTIGFMMMIKMTDRILVSGKGRLLFIVIFFTKMSIIILSLYFVSRLPGNSILFYGLGLSTIIIAIVIEGFYQLYHSRNKRLDRSII